MSNTDPIQFRFENIQVVTKTLNLRPSSYTGRGEARHNVAIEIKVNPAKSHVGIFTSCSIVSKDETLLASLELLCEFKIEEFEKVVIKDATDTYEVPKDLENYFTVASVSTLRGILFTELQGTYLHNAILPMISFNDLEEDNSDAKGSDSEINDGN